MMNNMENRSNTLAHSLAHSLCIAVSISHSGRSLWSKNNSSENRLHTHLTRSVRIMYGLVPMFYYGACLHARTHHRLR